MQSAWLEPSALRLERARFAVLAVGGVTAAFCKAAAGPRAHLLQQQKDFIVEQRCLSMDLASEDKELRSRNKQIGHSDADSTAIVLALAVAKARG